MNLADAIRKAAHTKGAVEVPPVAENNEPEVDIWQAVSQQPVPQPAPKAVEQAVAAPEIPHHVTQGGNAIRLEIFLNGEQMSGMLKAIMAGQHSVLTLREAASYLRVSPGTLEKLAEDGEIPAVEIDGRYRFPKSNLDDWLAHQSASNEEEKDVA